MTTTQNDSDRTRLPVRARAGGALLGVFAVVGTLLLLRALLPTASAVEAGAIAAPAHASVAPAAHEPSDEAPGFTTLKQAMAEGISVPFGMLSALAFHEGELDEESLESVHEAARTLRRSARALPLLQRRNFSIEESTFFREEVNRMGIEIDLLFAAVERRDSAAWKASLDRVDQACQRCHTQLAPHLVQRK